MAEFEEKLTLALEVVTSEIEAKLARSDTTGQRELHLVITKIQEAAMWYHSAHKIETLEREKAAAAAYEKVTDGN